MTKAEQLRIAQAEVDRLTELVNRQREYIDLCGESLGMLIVMAKYPTLEAILPDPAKLARMAKLKRELYPDSPSLDTKDTPRKFRI